MLEYIPLLSSVAVIHILALISPGPDFLMVIKNSLQYSRKTGVFTAIGLGGGIAVHISYCIAGLAVIISQSILIFTLLKLLGAAYLFYIGYQSIVSKPQDIRVEKHQPSHTEKIDISKMNAIKIGFFTNVLNPKATLFFLSLFAMVIPSSTPFSILIIISLMSIFLTIMWFIIVALFFTQTAVQKKFNQFQSVFNKIFGGLLIALALKIAFSK